ncbi:hypothetical protein BJX63DRAFT_85394 [Aspergillus granulosus]|uniref:Uncharacterized protein n=1 Tax=Aspergillus granulosus TaxID=176169 RepID=A0ABR4HTQ8_9EURO
MNALQQRLAFASMWAFEDIGIQELETELRRGIPLANLHCEYSPGDEVLFVKGKFESQMAPIAKLVSAFIEKQKSKDLLDTIRIRLLALPSAVRDNTTNIDRSDTGVKEGLLALDDDSGQIIPHQMTQVTKLWLSSAGGIGCFGGNEYQKTLRDIAKGTGTEITVPNDLKAVRVSGRCTNDVDDALAKLSEIEKPLLYIRSPEIVNLDIRPDDQDTRYMIQPAVKLSSTSIRRILADPADQTLVSNVKLGQMFVTAFYSFDQDAQKYIVAKNLVNPPKYSSEIAKSRLWNDFIFQEVGNGDEFATLESIIDNNPAESHLESSVITYDHPFLTPEKAKQVKEWVADESNMGASDGSPEGKPDVSHGQSSRSVSPSQTLASPKVKRKPGIKVRRPIQPAQPNTAQDIKAPSPHKPSAPQLGSDIMTSTPRKKWKLKYEPPSGSPSGAQVSESQCKLKGIVGSRNQPTNELAMSNAWYLGNKSPSALFDARDYGLKKKSPQSRDLIKKPSKAEKSGRFFVTSKPLIQGNVLIDVTSDDTIDPNLQPLLGFDTPANIPALIPKISGSSNAAGNSDSDSFNRPSILQSGRHAVDLLGLDFNEIAKPGGSTSSISLQDTSSNKAHFTSQAARLISLSAEYSNSVSPRMRRGHTNRLLENQVIEQFEGSHKPETEQFPRETQSRQFHTTMNQKTASSGLTPKRKSAKQATLMAAWGISERKEAVDGNPVREYDLLTKNPQKPQFSERGQEKQQAQKQKDTRFLEDIRRFFEAMKPTLEAAESFPGILTFEIQIGLVFIPSLPKTCNTDSLISPTEWSRILQPQNGVIAPTTKFFNRVTVCGSDVDHIIDLKRSKADGKSRIFEQEYTEYNVSYEFHCRTKPGDFLIVVIDEQGKYTIKNPNSMLGAVNLHFPKQIWDARAVVESTTRYHPGMNPELEEAVKYLVDHVWIPAGKSIHIFTCLPNGNKLTLEKVFMKRWTRHRFIHPGEAPRSLVKTLECGSQVDDNEHTDAQDIFLQITEVQDLFVGVDDPSTPHRVRARCTSTAEMIQRGKMWYEASLASPALEAILKDNANLEIGERTEDWRAADLFGEYAALLTEESSNSAANPVAAAIGAGGIGNLLEVAKTIVPKIDGVGYFNSGPIVVETLQGTVGDPEAPKGKTFEELDSVKEVESVTARIDPSVHDPEVSRREKFERDYW